MYSLLQLVDGAVEVEVLMKRMVELQQQQEEEECTQEEMVSRFERERSESIPTGRCPFTVVSHIGSDIVHSLLCLFFFSFSGRAGSSA